MPDPLTLDTHVDIPRTYMREARFDPGTDTELRVDLGKMKRGGLDAAFFVIFVEQGPRTPEGYAAAFAAAERKISAIEDDGAQVPGPHSSRHLAERRCSRTTPPGGSRR